MHADAFWRFSLAVYQRPGVMAACLALQDRNGVDVNMALFCLWTGMTAGRLDRADVAQAAALSEAWAARAVRPLRALRRDLKEGVAAVGDLIDVDGFRTAVKDLELEAERRQQAALAAFAPTAPVRPGAEAARANYDAYLTATAEARAARATTPDPATEQAAFETLIDAAETQASVA